MVDIGSNVSNMAISIGPVYTISGWSLALWVGVEEPIYFPAPCENMNTFVWYTVGIQVGIQNGVFAAQLLCSNGTLASLPTDPVMLSAGYLSTVQALTDATVYLGQPSPLHPYYYTDSFKDSSIDLLGLVVINSPVDNDAFLFQELFARIDSLHAGSEASEPISPP